MAIGVTEMPGQAGNQTRSSAAREYKVRFARASSGRKRPANQ